MIVTFYTGDKNPVPSQVLDLPWDELVECLQFQCENEVAEKDDLLAFAPHELASQCKKCPRPTGFSCDGNLHRLAENVQAVTFLVLDLDAPGSLADLWAAFRRLGIAACMYASPSDTPAAPRVRVVAPISRPLSVAECRRSRFAFAELLGLAPGCGVEGAKDAAKLFFVGRKPGTEPRECEHVPGAPVDVDALLATPLTHVWEGAAKAQAVGKLASSNLAKAEALAQALPAAVDGHEGGKTTLKAAIEIAKVTKDERATLDVLARVYSPRCVPPWGAVELAHKAAEGHRLVDEAAKRLAGVDSALDRHRGATDVDAPVEGMAALALDTGPRGAVLRTVTNVLRLLEYYGLDQKIRFDETRGRIVVAGVAPEHADIPDGQWKDVHYVEIRRLCERHELEVEIGTVQQAVEMQAHRSRFNPMRDWLIQCAEQWDGVARVDGALERYWGVRDPHAALVSRVWLLSLVARMLDPGCEVQTCLVMLGDQGVGKSRSLKALVGDEWFADSPLPIGDKDAAQIIRGKALWELGEGAIMQKKSAEDVKAFLSAPFDTYRPSHGRAVVDVPRTCTFVLTVNPNGALLHDPTGARRFMPVTVGDVDVEGVKRDREQLFGEAVARLAAGEDFYLTREGAATLAPSNEAIGEHDAWEDLLADWLVDHPRTWLTWQDVIGCLHCKKENFDRGAQMRLGACLKRMGWKRIRKMVDGVHAWGYEKA